jgi:hypothetical protein
MGTLTLVDFRTEVRVALKNRPDSATALSDTRLNRYINMSYVHISRPEVFRHREMMRTALITLVSGTNEYTFTPDSNTNSVVAIRSVAFIDSTTLSNTARRRRLTPRDPQYFDDTTFSAGSNPSSYAIDGDTMIIDPVPGSLQATKLLLVREIIEPPALVAGLQQTLLRPLWDELVILGAKWMSELYLGYRDQAEATKLDYASLLNEFKAFDDLHGREDFEWQTDVRTESAMESA